MCEWFQRFLKKLLSKEKEDVIRLRWKKAKLETKLKQIKEREKANE